MSNLNTDITYIPAPVNLDRHIQSIQKKLEGLPWLEKSFGRAYRVPVTKHGHKAPQFYPGRFIGGKDYQDLSKNDQLKSYSFIVAQDNADYDRFSLDDTSMIKQGVSVIFWLDLSKIDSTKDYIFTEELRANVRAKLSSVPVELEVKNFYSDASNVFRGFDSYQKDMMYPYACMRFDVNISYLEEC